MAIGRKVTRPTIIGKESVKLVASRDGEKYVTSDAVASRPSVLEVGI